MTASGLEVFHRERDAKAESSAKIVGVYTITCSANGRVYFGSSTDLMNRIYGHKSRLRSGAHPVKELQEDFDRYGEWQFLFAIQELCDDPELALALESVMILRARGFKALYNRSVPKVVVPFSGDVTLEQAHATAGNVEQCLNRIRRFRTDRGLNKFALATLAGIPEGITRNMDDADWNPTVKTLQKLEAVIPPEYQPSLEAAA